MIKYGNAAAQVFSAAVSGNAWNYAGLGGPLAAGIGGTNGFGNDKIWDYKLNDMCPLSGGGWSGASDAGLWALYLSSTRITSTTGGGMRAALYL